MLKTFTFLLEISISLCIIYYLNQLDKIGCKCSLNYKHDYILYYTIFILLYAFIKFFIMFISFQSVYAQSLNNKDSLDLNSINIEYLKEGIYILHISYFRYITLLSFIVIR